jgi:hypothetical protein
MARSFTWKNDGLPSAMRPFYCRRPRGQGTPNRIASDLPTLSVEKHVFRNSSE